MNNLDKKEEARILYNPYSEWARHFHSNVWIITVFGITLGLGGVAFIDSKTPIIKILLFAIGSIGILAITYLLAIAHSHQVTNYLSVLNALEMSWEFRAEDNVNDPLFTTNRNVRKGYVKIIRKLLFWGTIIFWLILLGMKIIMVIGTFFFNKIFWMLLFLSFS